MVSYKASLPVRGAWVEINTESVDNIVDNQSLPVRGAWVEMLIGAGEFRLSEAVAPRAGSVG